jgi:D-alanyl-D-alanine-carboxypeptidase/D-alanyl-D-alanine-endopeptidase
MNLPLKAGYTLVVALTILGANHCPAAESSPAATPASQGFAGPSQAQSAPDIVGTWSGTAKSPAREMTLVLHVERGVDGILSAKIENASQSPGNLRTLSEIKVTGSHLVFRNANGNPSYEGDWDNRAQEWKGILIVRGNGIALDFAKGTPAPWQLPSDSEIAKVIAEQNAPRAGQGIVVGVLTPDGQRIVAGGTGVGANFDRSTLFEIGSITKVFTALILADMVNKGEVSLDDPAVKYLPAGHKMPGRNGRQITLRDLATHRSGLPRMDDDMRPINDPDGPFADYDEKRLLAFLDRYPLTRDPGSQWEYSNLGVGLLGYLLARAAETDYETLLRERITRPLRMNDTMITLPPPYAARLAPGFDAYMRPAKPWNLAILTGAGGIRSSVADMLTFAAAVIDPNSSIAPAVKTMLSVRTPSENPQVDQALGWGVLRLAPDRELLRHSGQTGGYRAMLALDPKQGRAAVALANTAVEPSTVDLVHHILLGRPVAPTTPVPPAPPPPTQHTEISLPAEQLENFVGRYDFGSRIIIAVTREGTVLRAQREAMVGAQALQIFPKAPLAFFWKAVDAQIEFTIDANGAVTGAGLSQGGQLLTGKRILP